MSVRSSRGYKIFLVLLSLAFLGGAGYLAYLTFFKPGGSAKVLESADAAYAQGAAALDANPDEAFKRFDEAVVYAERGLNAYAAEVKEKPADDGQKKVEGKLHWTYARALRDRAYAQAKKDGKPLNEPTDTTTGKTYRAVQSMPEADEAQRVAKQRAVDGLMRASEQLADNPEVVLEATRVALVAQPLNWGVVERLMKATLKFNPNDSRANYFLARFEFDQPQTENGVWAPRPADKKDKERMADALKYLSKAEENKVPYWRAVHLRAEILAFEAEAAAKAKNDGTAKAKGDALDAVLFGKGGAVEKAAAGEEMAALSSYDGNGILALLELAMKRATDATADREAKVRRVVEDAIAAANHIADSKTGGQFIPGAGETTLDLLLHARQVLKPMDRAWWAKVTADAEGFLSKHPAANTRIGVVGKRTELAPDSASATKVLAAGVEAARKEKVPAAQMSDLLAELANLKLLANEPAAEVEKLISELRALDAKHVKARVDYLEGVLAERQGRLAQARKLYDAVLDDKEAKGTPLAFLAHMRLGPVCLATGDPAAAARHFGLVADRLAGSGLTADERAWAEQATSGKDEVTALQAVATVRAKMLQMQQEAKGNPGKPMAADAKQQFERTLDQLTKNLRPPSNADRTARLAVTEFELAAGDREGADKRLASLMADYPDDVTVLRAAVARAVMPDEGKKEPDAAALGRADERIEKFLRANPVSKAGKLFKAEWLVRTKRPGEAVEYLKGLPEQDDVVKRLLAGALLQTGAREEAQKVLAQLPPDLGVDLAIIQAAGSKEEAEKGVQTAIGRYENNGLLKLYDGLQKLNAGKYEEAARAFRDAGEFTAISGAATTLLQRALIAYAAADRKRAAPFIHALIQETPNQPGLYQAAALVAKYADDIGAKDDQWGAKKTMYAAVNQWANLSASAGTPAETVGMVKVAYHDMAGNPLAARQEAVRVLSAKPKHMPALVYLAQSFLFGPAPDLAEAKKYIDLANAVPESNPTPVLLKGAWLEQSGKADDAARLYEGMMGEYPGVSTPYARRVELAAAAKKPGEAASWAQKWVDKFPTDSAGVTELVRRLAEAGEEDTAAKKGDDWIKGRVDAATADLVKRVPAPPADKKEKELAAVRAGANLAVAAGFYRANKYPEAKKRVEAVLKDDPDSAVALMMAGDIAMADTKWDDADRLYRQRLAKAPEDFVAANNLAWVLAEHKNNPAEALKLMDAARLSGNDTPVAAERLPADFLDTYGRVYLKLNAKDKFPAMRDMFEGAVRRYADDPRLFRLLGEAYLAIGDNSRALAALNTAIKLADDPAAKSVPEEQKKEAKQAAEAAKSKLAGK